MASFMLVRRRAKTVRTTQVDEPAPSFVHTNMFAPLSSDSDNEGESHSTHARASTHAEEASEGAACDVRQGEMGGEQAREHTPPAVEHAVVFSNRFDCGAQAASFLPVEAHTTERRT